MTKNKASLLPLKEQYALQDEWLKDRLNTVLPKVMNREQIDMWVVACKEYNEDPVFLSMVPSLFKTALRLSVLVFLKREDGQVERYHIGRPYPILDGYYTSIWNPEEGNQWECLNRLIEKHGPNKIGFNFSSDTAVADGLTKTLYEEMKKYIHVEEDRLVSAHHLCVGWLETRTKAELEKYEEIIQVATMIIEETFSKDQITVGKTNTTDLVWYMLERIHELGLEAWFTPTMDLQRKGDSNPRLDNEVIQYGDILHCDIGIKYLGLCTDAQRIAYVSHPSQIAPPEGLVTALKQCNQFQDIVTREFIEGRTGNDILVAALSEATQSQLKAMLYSHPIGIYGHGPGPCIGLYDCQAPMEGKGDYKLFVNTCYALELNTTTTVPEWGNQEVVIYLEETIGFTSEGVTYFNNRQTEWLTI